MTARDDETARLIAVAEATLADEILPHLPAEGRYAGLMVARALAIAARRVADAGARQAAAEARLEAFAPEAPAGTRIRAVAAGLRNGTLALSPDLHAALVAIARAETLESNPRARALGAHQSANGSAG
jgi:hypothetical protein